MSSSAPTVNYRVLSAAEAARLQLANLGLPTTAPAREGLSPETVAAEILRSALWGLSRSASGSTWIPVHVTKLLNRAVAAWQAGRWAALRVTAKTAEPPDQKATEFLRQVLEDCELIGDVVSLPKGMWLPAPVRAVHLSRLGCWLLVGGVPTAQFPPAVRERLEYKGAARLLAQEPGSLNVSAPIQSSEEWLRAPADDLLHWTRKTMDEAEIKPFSAQDGGFRFYAPGSPRFLSSKDNLQINRWHESVKIMPDGRCLFRQTTAFGAVRYGIAEIRSAKIAAAEYVDLRDGGARRLMYGLDAIAGCRTRCRRESAGGDHVYILNNEVPGPERRLLATVGQLRKNDGDAYYPRRWVVPQRYSAEVEKALARLYVTVEAQQP